MYGKGLESLSTNVYIMGTLSNFSVSSFIKAFVRLIKKEWKAGGTIVDKSAAFMIDIYLHLVRLTTEEV